MTESPTDQTTSLEDFLPLCPPEGQMENSSPLTTHKTLEESKKTLRNIIIIIGVVSLALATLLIIKMGWFPLGLLGLIIVYTPFQFMVSMEKTIKRKVQIYILFGGLLLIGESTLGVIADGFMNVSLLRKEPFAIMIFLCVPFYQWPACLLLWIILACFQPSDPNAPRGLFQRPNHKQPNIHEKMP